MQYDQVSSVILECLPVKILLCCSAEASIGLDPSVPTCSLKSVNLLLAVTLGRKNIISILWDF